MRRAILDDVPRMMELGQAMHTESRFRRFRFNYAKAEGFFHRLLGSEHGIVLVHGDPVHAMLVAYVDTFWWGDDLESYDLLVYVAPEMRGRSSAVRLVNEYKRITHEMGVADPKISTGTGIDTARTGKFFERLGFQNTNLGFTLKAG